MAEPIVAGRTVTLRGLNIHGIEVWTNQLGPFGLRRVVREIMELIDVDEVIIEGSARVTGAKPGRKPRPIRFSRKALPDLRAAPSQRP